PLINPQTPNNNIHHHTFRNPHLRSKHARRRQNQRCGDRRDGQLREGRGQCLREKHSLPPHNHCVLSINSKSTTNSPPPSPSRRSSTPTRRRIPRADGRAWRATTM